MHTTFIGIDPTAGQRPITYAALDADLRLLALGQGDMNEVLAFVGGQRQAFVAISAPQRPNKGLMAKSEVREGLSPKPRPGRYTNCRLAEYLLRQQGIQVYLTPAKAETCPTWKRLSFKLYKRLEDLGYRLYPQDESALQYMEVYPHGCFVVLLGRRPFHKHTLEGRLQRQLILHEAGLDISDPLRFFEEITRYRLLQGILPLEWLHTPEELDALAAAYTAWLASTKPDEVILLGDPQEGQVVLPVAQPGKSQSSPGAE
ncbi:MAG: DUF429 domain-containing protein [Chloroflexota bacterium]